MLNSPLFRDPGYLPTRDEIETWKWPSTSRLDNWDDYVNHNPMGFSFEIMNAEFIESFVEFIKWRIKRLLNDRVKQINIVETWAGNGKLWHFLRQSLISFEDRVINLISTDDLSWEQAAFNPYFLIKRNFPVEVMDYKDAMDLDPDIVITSWMPKEEDWTKQYRKRTTVNDYILIGNRTDCGNDETWDKKLLKKDWFSMEITQIPWQMCFRDYPGHYKNSFVSTFTRR